MNRAADRRGYQILLISANRCTTPEPVFPLGLAYVSAALREAGHQITWLDLLVQKETLESIFNHPRFDLVGISLRNIDDVLIRKQELFVGDIEALVKRIHERWECPVVLGGSGFSILPQELLELTTADFGIIGEGEAALPALIDALETGSPFEKISGLVSRRDGHAFLSGKPSSSASVTLEPGDRPSHIAAHYLQTGGVLNVQTQRGCSHRCCYCTYPLIEGTRHRTRPAEAVVSDFEQLQSLGARYAFIVDSVFNSSHSHVAEICESLIRRDCRIRWGCFLRPQHLTRELMELMTRAGLTHIEFGSDSFSDEVLGEYEKDLTFDDIRVSSDVARAAEIDLCHFVIAGGPGETPRTLRQGFENSLLLGRPVIMAVPGMRVYPGTRLFQRALREGQIRADTDLLKPTYYLSRNFTLDELLDHLKEFARESPNWIVGDADPAFERLVAKLRQRGVTGPLWSYFSAAQRLWPAGRQ
jgi:radical SAM superfamily enzyme YgiQ (UPF0313 family)